MAFKFVDRTKETTTTTGTGAVTLLGAAAGFQAFSAGLADQDICYYLIQEQSGPNWEMGIGLYTAATPSLTRSQVLASSNAGAAVVFAAGTKDVILTPDAIQFNMSSTEYFGDGADGDLIAASGTTSLNRDTYYRNVTLTGTAVLNLAGYQLFVNGILDLSNAGAGAIIAGNGGAGGAGAAVATGGTGGAPLFGVGVGAFNNAGGAGGTGTTTVGGQGTVGVLGGNGGGSGASGAGGTSATPNAGGASRPAVSTSNGRSIRRWCSQFIAFISTGIIPLPGGASGAGGGAGGGNGAVAGPGGGGGGAGGNVGFISARFIKRGASTAASCIQNKGGPGGVGGTTATATNGGGGGGAGGGGGYIFLAYLALMGVIATNAIDVSGGNGGDGGDGNTTGTGGTGGNGGASGAVYKCDMGNPQNSSLSTSVVGAFGTAGTVPTHGTGGVGTVGLVNL